MNVVTMLEYEPNEIYPTMAYIAETFMRGSNPTKTGRAKRIYQEYFGDGDKSDVDKMLDRCKRAYRNGLHDVVTLHQREADILHDLEIFCQRVNGK